MLLNFLSQISWQIQLIRELLTSERGLMHRSKRPVEPEAVFGQIKYDSGFKRFMLKSLPKVSVEFGLVALAHNLRKYASNLHSIDEKIPKKPLFLQRSNGLIEIIIFPSKKQVA